MSFVDGVRIFNTSLKRKNKGWKKYSGNSKEICEKIIEDCWNGNFFQTSAGHFNQFYVRDFAFITQALIKLGHKNRVRKTLEYSLNSFKKKGKITSQIQPNGKAVESFGIASDTVPLYIHTFIVSNNQDLLNKEFLNKIIKDYEKNFIGKDGFVRQDKYFGWMRDHYKTYSSCYSNCMLLMLKNDLKKLGIKNNIKLTKKEFLKEFWNGEYFYYDRRKQNRIGGSANTYPFWCNIINEKNIYKNAMASIKKEGLDKPIPLKYEKRRDDKDVLWYLKLIMPNYEGDAVWVHLGMCYMDICPKSDLKKYLKQYNYYIIKNKNFLEVFDKNGNPYKNLIYCTDEGMSWAASYLSKI